jgi:hypothetical protein
LIEAGVENGRDLEVRVQNLDRNTVGASHPPVSDHQSEDTERGEGQRSRGEKTPAS